MFWGIGERLGNLVQGRGFRTNVEYGIGQLEDEERKRRQAQPAPTPQVSLPPSPMQLPTVPNTQAQQAPNQVSAPRLQVARPSSQMFELESAKQNLTPEQQAERASSQRETNANLDVITNYGVKGVGELFSGVARIPQAVGGFLNNNFINRAFRSEAENQAADITQEAFGKPADWMDQTLEDTYGRNIDEASNRVYDEQISRGEAPQLSMPVKIAATAANVTGQVADIFIPGLGAVKAGRAVEKLRPATQKMRQEAETAIQTARRPESELGAMGDGTISPNRAQAAQQQAQARAQQLTARADEADRLARQADELPPQPAPQVVAPRIQQEQPLVPFDEAGPQQVDTPPVPRPLDETQEVITEQTLAPQPEAPVAQAVETATPLESPITAQSRVMAENTVPVQTVASDVPATGNAADVPTTSAFGRKIPLTKENGYESVGAADGGTVYTKERRVGSNRKGDVGFERSYYNSNGDKITKAQFDAMVSGQLRTAQKQPTAQQQSAFAAESLADTPANAALKADLDAISKMSDGDLSRTSLSAVGSKPTATTPPTNKQPLKPAPKETTVNPDIDNLGDIARRTIVDGGDMSTISKRIEAAAEAVANRDGLSWEKIARQVDIANRKMQADKGVRKKFNYDTDVKLTKAEDDLYRRVLNEQNTLRDRIDPKLMGDGQQPFYVARQRADEDFDPSLVNETRRSKDGGLETDEVDYTFKPTEEYIRRYSDAKTTMSDNFVDALENVVTKKGDIKPTGVKVSDEVKTKLKEGSENYVKIQDDVIRAVDRGDDVAADKLMKQADDQLNKVLADVAQDVRKTGGSRKAVQNMLATRLPYIQSTVRSNMFVNVVNRLWDQTAKAQVQLGEKLFLRKTLEKSQAKSGVSTFATSKADFKLANDLAKGTLSGRLARDFKTSVKLEVASRSNALTKALQFVDTVYRAGSTAWTGAGDLVKNATRMANLATIQKARNAGITDSAAVRDYVVKARNTPEYKNLLADMESQYAGYVSLARYRSAAEAGDPNIIKTLSKFDNAIKNAITSRGGNARVAAELNDLIMPPTTGFAAATARVAGKGLNAMALGILGFRKGAKLMQSSAPNAQAIGTLNMARSIIDGVAGGGMYAGGMYLGLNGQWTGSYPSDSNEAARWEREGITPNTMRIPMPDGTTLQIEPGRVLGVLGLPLVIPTVVGNAIKEGVDVGDAIGQAVDGTLGQFISNFGVDALSDSIVDLTNLTKGNDFEKARAQKNLMNRLGFTLSNALTPAAGIQNNAANLLDENKRETSGDIGATMASRNPFTRPGVDVRLDNTGQPVRNNARLGGSQSLTIANDRPEASESASVVDKEVSRLAKEGFETMPAREVKNDDAVERTQAVVGSNIYNSLDDEGKADLLKKSFSDSTYKDVTRSIKDADLFMETPSYKNATDERKAEMRQSALLGTKFKDISQDLDPEARSVLMEGKLMGVDNGERDKWLENTKTARDYNVAAYENAIANKTLTAKDDSLQEKTGLRYKATASQVDLAVGADASTLLAYKQLTKKQFEALADDNPLKAKLWALDQARSEAGVSLNSSDTTLTKFGANSSGSGGRGGSKAVSVPSIGGGGGSRASEQKYISIKRSGANAVPQVAKATPKRKRSISVTRGVKL